ALDALGSLRAISRLGIGVDMVDTEAATRFGVAVANTPDYCTEEVALHALALAFSLLRGVVDHDAAVRRGEWDPVGGYPAARRPSATTIGILGFGRIGSRVAQGALAVGFDVIVHDLAPMHDHVRAIGAKPVELDELLTGSDLITLHAPLTAQTRQILGATAFAQMKRGAFVVNTTRGELVDEPALVAALERGHLGGAALDVFAREPLSPDSPLRRAPRVVLTPHSAWYSPDALRELPRRAAENLVSLLAGKDSPALLNPEFAQHLRTRQLDAR
ncbi:MAG: C-terminal binding protein, partial [Actinomycetota bacterium]|nr:C-terminal binding protein [Actinomycetota bacterium]